MKLSSKGKFDIIEKIYQTHTDSRSGSSSTSQLTKKEVVSSFNEFVLKFNFPHLSDQDSISFDYNSIISACPVFKKKFMINLKNSTEQQVQKVKITI